MYSDKQQNIPLRQMKNGVKIVNAAAQAFRKRKKAPKPLQGSAFGS